MKRILVVEDEPLIRRSIARTLKNEYIVTVCENGSITLNLAKENEFDIILSDVMMPEMDGVAFVEALRSVSITIPVVLMSGEAFGLREKIQLMLFMGTVSDFIDKPFSPEALRDRLRKFTG